MISSEHDDLGTFKGMWFKHGVMNETEAGKYVRRLLPGTLLCWNSEKHRRGVAMIVGVEFEQNRYEADVVDPFWYVIYSGNRREINRVEVSHLNVYVVGPILGPDPNGELPRS